MPMRDVKEFIKTLDDTLKHFYKPKVEFLICGDINTDYLIEIKQKKKKLASLKKHTICCTELILQQEFKVTPVLSLIIYLRIRV